MSPLFFLLLLLLSPPPSAAQSCPLDFQILRKFLDRARNSPQRDTPTECRYALQGLQLVLADYLRRSSSFLPPPSAATPCWSAYQSLLDSHLSQPLSLLSRCGFQPQWLSSPGCMNLTTRSQFESLIPSASLSDVRRSCDQPLENNSPCAACTTTLSRLRASYLTGPTLGNVTDCISYAFIYAAGAVNSLGPSDDGTAVCLFLLDLPSRSSSSSTGKALVLAAALAAASFAALALCAAAWILRRKRRKARIAARFLTLGAAGPRPPSLPLDQFSASTTLIRFSYDDIKAATLNFSRENIIGRGGYGNVYRGILSNGSEVAIKRFKNCSAAGDASFTHEVEVIAGVRHVNLVALRGYCVATARFEGHQRMIVCDLMRNGSVHDHLFGSAEQKLSWPARHKIAVGTARGLAYLHYGAQPAIIHRDIKASNILLDAGFEPKLADFGLAKYAPEGVTHMSTRVAGTLGYVAPEYALYGQLTEKSDVYSFGVVLLELLSGRKALVPASEGQPWLLTDWAWSLVREGRALDVIEDGMPELGPKEVMEKYVLVAVLCSHPQLHARPSMDQIVKLLETDSPVPSIPERPISIIANIDEIERSMGSSSSGHLSSSTGYNPFTLGTSSDFELKQQ